MSDDAIARHARIRGEMLDSFDEEQNLRFLMRIHDPLKQWKLSPMDLESRRRWEIYTKAKEEMIERTHIPESRWWVVEGARQETGATELHSSFAAAGPLSERPSRPDCLARSRAQAGLRAPPGSAGFVRSGNLLGSRRHLFGTKAGDGNSLYRNTENAY